MRFGYDGFHEHLDDLRVAHGGLGIGGDIRRDVKIRRELLTASEELQASDLG